jgi:hypothetical protein
MAPTSVLYDKEHDTYIDGVEKTVGLRRVL